MTELKSHFKKHHKQECKKCDQKFLHKHALDEHMKEHHKNKVKGFACETCKNVAKTIEEAKQHSRQHKETEDRSVVVHECPLCGFVTKESTEVDTHMKQKHNIHVYRCNKCIDYVAGTQNVLNKHMSEHINK